MRMLLPHTLRISMLILLMMSPAPTIANEKNPNIPTPEPFTDLNLRFSNRPLIPPGHLITQTIPLTGLSVASSFVAPSPQAVIFEDDQHQRLAVLSSNETGQLTIFLLESLPLAPKLPGLVQCAYNRRCETDRTPLTGGLGCLAFCLKELFETVASNPTPR